MATSEEHDSTDMDRPKWSSAWHGSERHPLLGVADEVISAAEQASKSSAGAEEYSVLFDKSVLKRGIKGLDSVRLLIDAGHWEYATSATRQLFELLVNMEHLGSFADRDEALRIYNGFGLMQYFLAESLRIEFEKKRGRPTGSSWELSVRNFLDNNCAHFKLPPRADGTVRWRKSWSGKTTRALAELSPDPMRVPQYELLFSTWSEQTHATPGAFATGLFIEYEDEIIAEALSKIDRIPLEISQVLAGARLRQVQTLGVTTLFFLQIWHQLPKVPQPDSIQSNKWNAIIKNYARGKGFPIS